VKCLSCSKEAGRLPASLLMVLVALLSGCGADVSQQTVNTGQTLDCAMFASTVNQIFDANIGGKTCSASGCHSVFGSSGGAFKIYPGITVANSPQMQANYLAAKGFANLNSAADSKLLLEPLIGSQSIVGSHAGGDIFLDTFSDANYLTIFAWISNRITGPSACYP